MINWILFFITQFLPCRIISRGKTPYLERYYITNEIFLHRFIDIDGDKAVHSHPWYWAFSIILTGWYVERIGQPTITVKKRSWFNYINEPNYMHQIINIKPKTWTLFITGKRNSKGWGFYDDVGNYKHMKPVIDGTDYVGSFPIGRKCEGRTPL